MLVKFLGFALFSVMATCGFWLLMSILGFLPYWIWGQVSESKNGKNKGIYVDPYQTPLKTVFKKDDTIF